MKRKTRFSPGGLNPYQGDDIDPFSAVRNEDGGTAPRAEGPSSESLYDEATGKELSTRRNLETGEYYSTEPVEAPKKATRAAPKAPPIKDVPGSGRGAMAGRRAIDDIMRDAGGGGRGRSMGRTAADVDTFYPGRATGRAEIPVDSSMKGPAKQSSSAMDMSDTERQLANLYFASTRGQSRAGMNVMRLNKALNINEAARAAKPLASAAVTSAKEGLKSAASRSGEYAKEIEKEAVKQFTKPQAREVGSKVPVRPSQASKERAEAMERAKPILQSRKSNKAERAARTRRTEEDAGIEFSKGGSASRRADGCAARGKTRGKIY